ncbi:MAG: phage antirepressor KilAC domain-containing protein [Lachnospiraceae bacterium]
MTDKIQLQVNLNTFTVSAKELHQVIGIKQVFSAWFSKYKDLFDSASDYMTGTDPEDYQLSFHMAQYLAVAGRTPKGKEVSKYLAQVLQDVITEQQPKAAYYDLVLQCEDLISATVIAKDYGMSARSFNKLLNELGIQYKQGKLWVLYARYQGQGYMKGKTHNYPGSTENIHAKEHTYWTHRGRLFLYNYLKQQEIVPLIERLPSRQEDK